jgi:hypothetical protein
VRRWVLNGLLVAVSSLVGLLLGEAGLRLYQWTASGVPLRNAELWAVAPDSAAAPALPNLLDRELGWRPAAGYRYDGQGRRADGTEYPLRVSQGRHGFRRFGSGRGPRTLVVGDSYTQALDVSDERTYYALLEHEVGLQVWAVGSNGYGTLQELLLVEEHLAEVRPELVVWQTCYNDFMNNSFELESEWKAGNGRLHERPYLFGDEVAFRLPGHFERTRAWLARSTRLYEFVASRLARFASPPGERDELLHDILAHGRSHPGFREALAITDRLFRRLAARVRPARVLVFEACTTAAPFHPAVAELARRHGMDFAAELPGAIDLAQQAGQVLLSSDRVHWNEEGHRIVADVLAEHIRKVVRRGAASGDVPDP